MTEAVKEHIKRARKLREDRGVWANHWEELARVMLPRRLGFTSSPVDGDRRTEDIYDAVPMQAARSLANALGGIIRPDGQKWFHIHSVEDALDETAEAKEWIDQTEEVMRDAFDDPRSRFRQATGETDMDLVVFGTGVMYEGENETLNSLLFQSLHLNDAVVFFDDMGNPRGLYRFRKITLRQAVFKWGEEALSATSREKIRNDKQDEKVEFLHCVMPRKSGRIDAVMARNMPFTNLWIETEAEHVVEDTGYRDFPFVVPRWDTSSGETYGRSPAMIALPDSLTLQAMGETILVAGQRAADPPLAVPADAAFNEVNTFPGGLSYYDPTTAQGRNPFFEIGAGANMPLTLEMQTSYREQIFAAFFRNVLNLPVQGPQMTATEVIQRKEEFIREIGPVFGRLETEYTGPMVERAFRLLLRMGRLPPIPSALEGTSIRFEYQSPVKRMRQQIEDLAADQWVGKLTQLAGATGDMSVLDVVNMDEYSRFGAEAAGIPTKLVNSPADVEQKRQARAAAQEQAAQAQQMQGMAEMAKTAAGAAKDAGLVQGAQ